MLRVDITQRPEWWWRVIRDYENKYYADGLVSYDESQDFWKYTWLEYGFGVDPSPSIAWIEFADERDYTLLLLKYS